MAVAARDGKLVSFHQISPLFTNFTYFKIILGESQRKNAMPIQINPIMNEIAAERFSFGNKL
jgi:hypothetical protein